jgi:outer membrane protein OmpA-like peptidoglycan-associated protein
MPNDSKESHVRGSRMSFGILRSGSRALALAFVVSVFTGSALAQTTLERFEAERLMLNPGAEDSMVVESGRLLAPGALQLMVLAHYERAPLTLRSADVELGRILRYRLTFHLSAAYALTDRLQLEGQLPLIAAQRGDDLSAFGVAKPSSAGLGTPVVGARYGLLAAARGAPLDLSVGLGLGLPVGTLSAFGRANDVAGLTVLPSISLGRAVGAVVVGGQVTGVLRGSSQAFDTQVGSALDVAAMVATRGQGLRGELSVRSELGFSAGTEVEVLGGGRLPVGGGFTVFALGGPGLTTTLGTPSFRVLAGLGFSRPGQTAKPAPVCVEGQPYHLADCPNLDLDQDGVVNAADPCPTQAEDKDGFQDADGCPDLDNDGDKVPDAQDKCPLEPGDAAHQGCPFHDRDHDTVADEVDNCPDEAGDPANQGCKVEQKVVITDKNIEVKDTLSFSGNKVFFGTDKIELAADYEKMLDQVADVLRKHPEITRLEVQGYTDSTGEAAYNQTLSQRRASAVRDYLVSQGVAAGRLSVKGFGEEQPIASNDTAEGREKNRRVEFLIVERAEQPAAPEKLTVPGQ